MKIIKDFIFAVLVLPVFFLGHQTVSAQESIHISGKVIDNMTKKGVSDVSVIVAPVKEADTTNIGISTNQDGEFDFHFNFKTPLKLIFKHVSYYDDHIIVKETKAVGLKIEIVPKVIESEGVVITSDLVSEEELSSSTTVDRISKVDIEQLASFNVFDLVSNLREVDIATQSMTMQSVNTRGFNASANKRFLQLTDGVDNQAPGLSFPIGNLMGATSLDVASVEIMPGPSSAKYGSSALNGVLLTETKDPFVDEGFSLMTKGGVNNLQISGSEFFSAEGNGMYNFAGRFAKSFGNQIAVKITGEMYGGTDWKANNYNNIGAGGLYAERDEHPGYDGVNIYGDEDFAYLPVGSQQIDAKPDELVRVSRTGYREPSLVDYDIATRKLSGSLHYKFDETHRLMMEGRYGITNSLYTGDTRVRLDGFKMYQGKVDLTLGDFNFLSYSTWQDSGESYDISVLSDHLVRLAKSDVNWYRDFEMAYQRGVPILGVRSGSYEEARNFADSGITLLHNEDAQQRYEPGTDRFNKKVNEIKYSTSPDSGAAIRDNSKLYHVQSSYDLSDLLENYGLEFGGDFRLYDINSNGTIFPDTASNDISNYKFGGFVSINRSFMGESLKGRMSVRVDKNERFETQISPAIGFNYTPDSNNYFRFSYQNGFRYPGLREQFINKDLGKASLVGGLSEVVGQYDLPGNAITTRAIENFNDAIANSLTETLNSPEKFSREQAELNNLSILENGIVKGETLSNLQTEIAHTFEAGYKRLFNKNLYFDLNYYISFYKNFIGIRRLVKPRTSPTLDLYTAATQINNSAENSKYFVYSNAEGLLAVHGASFSLDYTSGGFLMGLNGTWTELFKDSEDPIVPGFNSPPFKMNFEWGHRQITENVGFKMIYKLRTQHEWRSPFIDGTIDTYGHFDIQFNVDIPLIASNLKFGITNLGVEKYYNIYGGPSIGSILFGTLTFNPNSF